MYLFWGLQLYVLVGTYEDAWILHASNSVFLIFYKLFEGLMFAWHMRSTPYSIFVFSSFLESNYTTCSVVCHSRLLVRASQVSLDVWDFSCPHSNFTTTYVTASYLGLNHCITFALAIPTCISVRSFKNKSFLSYFCTFY